MKHKSKEIRFGDLKQGQPFSFHGAYYMKTNLIDVSKKLSEVSDFCFCEDYNAVNLERGFLCWFHDTDCVDLITYPIMIWEGIKKGE